MFLANFNFNVDKMLLGFFNKRVVIVISFAVVIIGSGLLFKYQAKGDLVNKELYPVEAVKYIKKNLNVDEIRLFNDYNFGSYLVFNDIPVFIDSRADLYTKQFSGFNYDIFDDYEYIVGTYQEKFEFYKITHALIYKKNNPFYPVLNTNSNYKVIYDDENFALFEKTGNDNVIISYNN